jgi:hypothetical protein
MYLSTHVFPHRVASDHFPTYVVVDTMSYPAIGGPQGCSLRLEH